MGKSITLSQLHNWLNENKHLTWYIGDGGGFDTKTRSENGVPYIKYIYPSFDTRTMDIFAIEVSGLENFSIVSSEQSNKNLLDLLEEKINIYNKNRKKMNCKICLGIGCKYCS
jgi:hypothetical protein